MYGGAKYPRIFSRGVQYFGGYKISCDTGSIAIIDDASVNDIHNFRVVRRFVT